MRRVLIVIVLALVASFFSPASPASAGVGFTQVGKERQFKKFVVKYRRSCPGCTSTWYSPSREGDKVGTATGRAVVRVATYKIAEQNDRYDLYAVDVDISNGRRKGDEDWAWMDVTVQSIGRVGVKDATHTSGIGATNKDTKTKYPITIGAGFGPFSVGATVANFVSEAKGSSLAVSSASRGRQWRINKLSGVYHSTSGRFVRVADGKKPRFRVKVSANKDGARITCQQWADGYHCFVPRGFVTKSRKIGTTRQR